jgi:hypothetical protein
MAYEDRYCAYVDILGFRNLIRDLDANKITPGDMSGVFDTMQKAILVGLPVNEADDIKLSSISDAICLSSAVTGGGLKTIMSCLIDLTLFLLVRGYFVRGGLVKGKLQHDKGAVFGSALVRAFDIESKIARYPRIIILSDVYRDVVRAHAGGHDIVGMAQRADDGPMYLHPLANVARFMSIANDQKEVDRVASIFNPMAGMIQMRFDEATDEPRNFEKVQWFARYWNCSTEKYREHILAISGPGV